MLLIPPSLYILVILLLFIFFGIYIQFDNIPFETRVSFEHRYHHSAVLPAYTPTVPKSCQDVDFHWLVNDRVYWDGWESKSIFLRQDGQFTQRNVEIEQGDTVCIAVLVGPIPALAAIQDTQHYAPSDAIMMTAVNKEQSIKIPVKLQQHESFSHVYYAQIQFTHHGTYSLDTSVEYRSYFWEFPGFHPYRPNHFVSKNKVLVSPKDIVQLPCLTLDSLEGSMWKKEIDGEWRFVPPCRLLQGCAFPRRVHVWGDDLLRRNIDVFVRREQSSGCQNGISIEKIVHGDNKVIHFGSMNKPIGDSYNNWKQSIHEMIMASNIKTAADVVIIGVGNADLYKMRHSPAEFAKGFMLFMKYMKSLYGEQQTFIVKTPQWKSDKYYGKSEAFANVIRSIVDNERVLLWDTHQFEIKDNELDISFENSMLERIFCQLPQREATHKP